jgi:hypothetical protein
MKNIILFIMNGYICPICIIVSTLYLLFNGKTGVSCEVQHLGIRINNF